MTRAELDHRPQEEERAGNDGKTKEEPSRG
jgi:hypothetical protein